MTRLMREDLSRALSSRHLCLRDVPECSVPLPSSMKLCKRWPYLPSFPTSTLRTDYVLLGLGHHESRPGGSSTTSLSRICMSHGRPLLAWNIEGVDSPFFCRIMHNRMQLPPIGLGRFWACLAISTVAAKRGLGGSSVCRTWQAPPPCRQQHLAFWAMLTFETRGLIMLALPSLGTQRTDCDDAMSIDCWNTSTAWIDEIARLASAD